MLPCRLHLIETSPAPARWSSASAPATGLLAFHDSLDELPRGPLILVANEFLDALPIRQFIRRGHRLAPSATLRHGAPMEQPASTWTDASCCPTSGGRAWPERRRAGTAVMPPAAVVRRAGHGVSPAMRRRRPVAGLRSRPRAPTGDSLQSACRHGRPADPFALPRGQADLTAHVDFAAHRRRRTRRPAPRVHGPVEAGQLPADPAWLVSSAAARLAAGPCRPRRRSAIMDAAQRLAQPDRAWVRCSRRWRSAIPHRLCHAGRIRAMTHPASASSSPALGSCRTGSSPAQGGVSHRRLCLA